MDTMEKQQRIALFFRWTTMMPLLCLILLSLMIFSAPLRAQEKPLIKKTGQKYWIPNTTVKTFPYASAVCCTEHVLYIAMTGGLGEINLTSGSFSIYPVGDDEFSGDITSLALVDDTLWIATRRGIRLFNTKDRAITGSVTPQNSPLGDENNILFTVDRDAKYLYVMSFGHAQRYDMQKKRWEDLNHIFSEHSLGEPGSNIICSVDDANVWIASSAHDQSKGGLLRYNKKDKIWGVYRDQLVGTKSPKRIDIADMLLASPTILILANDKIARYDMKQNKWENFPTSDLSALGPQVASLYPRFTGYYCEDSNCLTSLMASYLTEKIRLEDFREVYFTGSTVIGLKTDSVTLLDGKRDDSVIHYTGCPLNFERTLGCDGVSRALFLTNRGLELLDASKVELVPLKNSEYFISKNDFYDYQCVWKGDSAFILIKKTAGPDEDQSVQFAKIYTIDPSKASVSLKTPKNSKWIEDLFLYKGNVYCATDKGLMVWKDGAWASTKEKVQWTPPPFPPPSRKVVYTLKGGKKIEWNTRGVLIY